MRDIFERSEPAPRTISDRLHAALAMLSQSSAKQPFTAVVQLQDGEHRAVCYCGWLGTTWPSGNQFHAERELQSHSCVLTQVGGVRGELQRARPLLEEADRVFLKLQARIAQLETEVSQLRSREPTPPPPAVSAEESNEPPQKLLKVIVADAVGVECVHECEAPSVSLDGGALVVVDGMETVAIYGPGQWKSYVCERAKR